MLLHFNKNIHPIALLRSEEFIAIKGQFEFVGSYITNTSSPMGNDRSPGSSIMFGDTIIYDAQRQVTLNLKQ